MCGELLVSCVVDLDRIYNYYPLNTPHICYKDDEKITIFHCVCKLIRFFLNNKIGPKCLPVRPRPLPEVPLRVLDEKMKSIKSLFLFIGQLCFSFFLTSADCRTCLQQSEWHFNRIHFFT